MKMPVNSLPLSPAGQRIPAITLGQDAAAAAYNDDRLGFLLATAREYGPVVQLWPGLILVTGPAEADVVFRRTGRDFFSDENFLLRKIDRGPESEYMASWLRSRRAALEGMTPAMLSRHAGWLAGRSRAFVADWLSRGTIHDTPRELERFTSESIARFSFGSAGPAGVPAAAQAMLDALFPVFSSPFVFPAYMRLIQPREWRVRRRLHGLHGALASAMAGRAEDSLSGVLIDKGLGRSAAVRVLTSMHLAGHGVPAAALAWAIVELARNPAEQDLAAAAAARWNGGGEAIPGQISRVVDETLRLWPPSWLSDRMTSQPVSCGSWALPGKARILMPLWVIHRTAACYPDPERFDSNRWRGLKPEPGAYLPFGLGPHWCLGARLARLELEIFLTVLLSRASIAVRGTVKPDARRTLTPSGFELEITPR
jgi:cytochrome P450